MTGGRVTGGRARRRTVRQLTRRSVVDAGRQELTSVPDRLAGGWWSVMQCALGAGLAWQLAVIVLGHSQPLFACVAAVVCLGIRPAHRLRRVAELAVGVSIGVGIGELLVRWIGAGAWQIAVVVAAALLAALLVQDSPLLTNQAGLQAVFVVALPQPPGGEIARWQDALVGGAAALLVAALLPADPWRQPRQLGQALAAELAAVLRDSAQAVRGLDPAAAVEVLLQARELQGAVARWDASLAEGHDISRGSLWRRDPAGQVWTRHRDLSRGLDRAAGNLRVLVRRLSSALELGEALPACLPGLLDELATVLDLLARDLAANDGQVARELREYGGRLDPVALHATSLSGAVAVAQLRTAVVDLLVGLGLPSEQARAVLPALR